MMRLGYGRVLVLIRDPLPPLLLPPPLLMLPFLRLLPALVAVIVRRLRLLESEALDRRHRRDSVHEALGYARTRGRADRPLLRRVVL